MCGQAPLEAGQERASQGEPGSAHGIRSDEPFTATEAADIIRLTFFDPHWPHLADGLRLIDLTRISVTSPHSLHLYS